MGIVKTTIVVDEKTWKEFKKMVSLRYGSSRFTSPAVEEAIKCFNITELLKKFLDAVGCSLAAYPSLKEVEERRPKLGTSAGEEIRRMRDEHYAGLS